MSSMVNDPSVTLFRLLTTSHSTEGKSPAERFQPQRSAIGPLNQTHRSAYVSFGGFLPVEESNSVWSVTVKRNELNVCLREVLLFEAIHDALSVFLSCGCKFDTLCVH